MYRTRRMLSRTKLPRRWRRDWLEKGGRWERCWIWRTKSNNILTKYFSMCPIVSLQSKWKSNFAPQRFAKWFPKHPSAFFRPLSKICWPASGALSFRIEIRILPFHRGGRLGFCKNSNCFGVIPYRMTDEEIEKIKKQPVLTFKDIQKLAGLRKKSWIKRVLRFGNRRNAFCLRFLTLFRKAKSLLVNLWGLCFVNHLLLMVYEHILIGHDQTKASCKNNVDIW